MSGQASHWNPEWSWGHEIHAENPRQRTSMRLLLTRESPREPLRGSIRGRLDSSLHALALQRRQLRGHASPMSEITELIGRARGGEQAASERVFALLYDDLRRLAAGQLRGEQMMRTTSLVHEAYLKIAKHGALNVNDRGHFFAVAARVMRQIVIDHVRSRAALKRSGDMNIASLDSSALQAAAEDRGEEVLALDAALVQLDAIDAPLAALVEMRFYAGLELSEISDVLDRSERSLKRDWRRARAFLQREMSAA